MDADASMPHIFLFPPAGGDTFYYYDLIKNLSSKAEVHLIKSRGLQEGTHNYDFNQNVLENIHYIDSVGLTCEIHLCGWSYGGLLAMEASRLLKKKGYNIASTHLIDTYSPIVLKQEDELKELEIVKVIMNDLGGLFRIKVPITDKEFLQCERSYRLGLVLDYLKEQCYKSLSPKRQEEFKANLWAMYHFVPQVFNDVIHFYQAEIQVPGNSCTSRDGWERWIKHQNIIDSVVEGNHYTMLEKTGAKILSEQLLGNIKVSSEHLKFH